MSEKFPLFPGQVGIRINESAILSEVELYPYVTKNFDFSALLPESISQVVCKLQDHIGMGVKFSALSFVQPIDRVHFLFFSSLLVPDDKCAIALF